MGLQWLTPLRTAERTAAPGLLLPPPAQQQQKQQQRIVAVVATEQSQLCKSAAEMLPAGRL